jgi:hypothetical protein
MDVEYNFNLYIHYIMGEYQIFINQILEMKHNIYDNETTYNYIWNTLFNIVRCIYEKLEHNNELLKRSYDINNFYHYCDKIMLELEYLDYNDSCNYFMIHEKKLIKYLKFIDAFVINQMF